MADHRADGPHRPAPGWQPTGPATGPAPDPAGNPKPDPTPNLTGPATGRETDRAETAGVQPAATGTRTGTDGRQVAVADGDEPGQRGSLTVKDRAVQRIAEAAALSVGGVVPAGQSTGTVGAALGRAYPRVDCDVAGGRVRAAVEVVGRWPTPAPLLGSQVRAAVTDQLERLAGLRVDAVDVTIAKIIRIAAPPRRRVQ